MCDSGESLDVSVCHTVNMTSPSICQPHDLPVYQPKCDSTWNSIHLSVCSSSVLSIQPSAKFTVKTPTIITGQNFPKVQFLGKFLSICTLSDSSVDLGSPSVTSSLSAENLSTIPGNNGENNTVSHLHEILVRSPSIYTSCIMSVIAPIHALSIPSVHPSNDKCQEIPDEFPSTHYGETFPSEITVKIHDDITLTLCNVKFPEKTPDNSNRNLSMIEFLGLVVAMSAAKCD